jgi:hypothetical protein
MEASYIQLHVTEIIKNRPIFAVTCQLHDTRCNCWKLLTGLGLQPKLHQTPPSVITCNWKSVPPRVDGEYEILLPRLPNPPLVTPTA